MTVGDVLHFKQTSNTRVTLNPEVRCLQKGSKMDYLIISPTPYDEDCAQVGTDNYRERALKEGMAFITQLRRQFGDEPPGTVFKRKWFPHDFGSYMEVVVEYAEDDEEAVAFAYKVESEGPAEWDALARQELGLEVR